MQVCHRGFRGSSFCPEPLELNAILIKSANRMEQEAMNTCFSNMVDQHTQVKNEILDTALSVAVNNHNNQTREPQLPDWDPQPSPRNTQDHPLPILTHADKVLSNWQQNTVTEIQVIRHCINTHARRLWYFANSRPTPIPKRDAEFRNILRPLIDVNDLKKELKKAKKGTTGRLTTVDELLALPDELLDAIRIICNMILSGECTSLLKCGDVAPLPKDIYRIRPITLLDPIFKIVDSILNARMMQVLQDNGLIADNVFGFIQGGAPEWAADLACTTQWHARRTGKSSFQVFLDATSAYDTISHSGVSAACSFAGVPRDVETTILAHLGGHNRIINTAYRLGDNRTTFSLGGGLAQGAPSSPLWYLFTSAPALLYTDNILKGYNLGQQESGTHILWSIVKSMDKPGRIFQNSSLAKAIEECNFMPRSAILDLQACSGSGTQYITYGNTIFQSSTVNADRSEILETDDRIKAENYADDNAINNGDMAETRDEVLRLLENTEQATDALTVSLSLVGVQTNLAKSFVTCSPRAHRLLKEPPTIRVSGIDKHGRLINNTLTPVQVPGDMLTAEPQGTGCIPYLGPITCAGGCIGPQGLSFWDSSDNKILQRLRMFKSICTSTQPDSQTYRHATMSIFYQGIRSHLMSNLPNPHICQKIRNTIANLALRSLGLATTIAEDDHLDVATDFLLCPMEMGGAQICDPIIRTCQDIGTALLGGLMHPNKTIRRSTKTTIEHSTSNQLWMLTERGDDTPRRRIQTIRLIAGLTLHSGSSTAPNPKTAENICHAFPYLHYQLSPTCKALLASQTGNQWIQNPSASLNGHNHSRTEQDNALTRQLRDPTKRFCIDITGITVHPHTSLLINGQELTPPRHLPLHSPPRKPTKLENKQVRRPPSNGKNTNPLFPSTELGHL